MFPNTPGRQGQQPVSGRPYRSASASDLEAGAARSQPRRHAVPARGDAAGVPAEPGEGVLVPLLGRTTTPAQATAFAVSPANRQPVAVDPAAVAEALRSYFPTPPGLARSDAVAWEQGVAALVGSLASALAQENIGPADLQAAIAALGSRPHELDGAFTVHGYIASGAGYVVGQVCYWLGVPGRVSIAAGLLVPNVALSSWRTLNELALRYAAARDPDSHDRLPAFIEQHFERQNQGFIQQAREAFLRNVRDGRQLRNLSPRDALLVLLNRTLPQDMRPNLARPAYAGEHAHVPTLLFLTDSPERIAGMVRSGNFTDVREIGVPAGWTNLHTLRTLMHPDFYYEQVLPRGPAVLAGQMLALTVNTAQRGVNALLEPFSRWLHEPVRRAPHPAVTQV